MGGRPSTKRGATSIASEPAPKPEDRIVIDPPDCTPIRTPDAAPHGDPVVLETLRTLATPAEVDFLVAAAFGDVDPEAVHRARESMAFLAGMAVRARNAGTPFAATWSLVVDIKRLDSLADPVGRAFWGRVQSAMRILAEPRPHGRG